MAEPIIELKNANIYQGNNLVLQNVNLVVNKGEFVYLVGKTGTGKSSLLKTLYGELELREGEGTVAGFALRGDMDIFPAYKAATWVTEAVGEKFDKNYIIKQRIFNEKPLGFQGWAMNTRRDIFKDKRVRKAIAHLVNRKEMIEKLAYNEYEPTNSYYPDYYLNGETNPNEAIEFDPEKARELLKEAGWKPNASGILEKDGKEFSITILDRDKSTEKYFTVFMEAAKQLGIKASIETTDLAAWSARIDKFDFDLTWAAWGSGVFKDPEPMWFSKYADENGQHNLAGIKNKEVDALIEKQKSEFSLAKRNTMVKKIDNYIPVKNLLR